MKLRHKIMLVLALMFSALIPGHQAMAANPYDCHAFKAYDGAGRYQGTVLCYALPAFRQERAVMICVVSADGTRVTLYGEFVGNATISRTGWRSGICSVSWQVV